ncbi:MAG: 8-amino-7-oxononanoate synthase [Pseudomonadota bacterium]|nr:8-amino-7-oxononanoate synthase [Pseudomonadota bacterium]
MKDLRLALQKRQIEQLYRTRRVAEGAQSAERTIDSRRVVSFCSNDYLGLANHPVLIKAFKKAADEYGVGSGAAHLINGHTRAHHALEEALAEFTGRKRALLFSTGYMANLGVVSALAGPGDVVFQDRLNHASLLDASLLCGARLVRYAHCNTSDLLRKLTARARGEKLILTDGVFSMDGDIAPISKLADVAMAHDAWLMVDDAHGIGVLGTSGRGTLEQLGMGGCSVPILVGTLGKALGTFGAFVAGSTELIETLIQAARTYIYTTAPPPAMAEAARAALRIAQQETWRREKLQEYIKRFRTYGEQLGLPLLSSETPIQPIIIGDAVKAKVISDALFEQGLLVTAIRPPTVPRGTARLRITFSADHTEAQLNRLLGELAVQIRRAA